MQAYWTLMSVAESTMETCLSVSPSITSEFFSELTLKMFLVFLISWFASLNPEIHTVNVKDSKKDQNTGILEIPTINADIPLSKTGNQPKQLKVCLGARVILATNVDTADKLINGSSGQISMCEVCIQTCYKIKGLFMLNLMI